MHNPYHGEPASARGAPRLLSPQIVLHRGHDAHALFDPVLLRNARRGIPREDFEDALVRAADPAEAAIGEQGQ